MKVVRKNIVHGKDISSNRLFLEDKKTKMLILNHKIGKDRLKQRDSGLNHVLCKIAKKNEIILAIDIEELGVGDKKKRAKILGRMIQNIRLIKKAKNKFKLLNYSNKVQARDFLLTLGLPTDMAKKAVD